MLGVEASDCFQTVDLYEKQNMDNVRCLFYNKLLSFYLLRIVNNYSPIKWQWMVVDIYQHRSE